MAIKGGPARDKKKRRRDRCCQHIEASQTWLGTTAVFFFFFFSLYYVYIFLFKKKDKKEKRDRLYATPYTHTSILLLYIRNYFFSQQRHTMMLLPLSPLIFRLFIFHLLITRNNKKRTQNDMKRERRRKNAVRYPWLVRNWRHFHWFLFSPPQRPATFLEYPMNINQTHVLPMGSHTE